MPNELGEELSGGMRQRVMSCAYPSDQKMTLAAVSQ